MPQIGRRVAFAIRDVYFPTLATVLSELHGSDLISGQVVGVSDSGLDAEAFVVVKVDGVEAPVVIATERVREPQDVSGGSK